MRILFQWLVVSLGIGTVTAIIRYLAVWYVMRRVRRVLSMRRRQREPQT